MSRIYPNISGEKTVTSGECIVCKAKLSETNHGRRFEVQVDIFRGDDEFETYCKKHAQARKEEISAIHRKQMEREAKAQNQELNLIQSLLDRMQAKYDVKMLTFYQWRINGVLDVYPKNRLYHDIKENKRGRYQDIFQFCERFFSAPPSQ